MTSSPMAREATSRSPIPRSLWQILATDASIAWLLTGRFSSAFCMPARSLLSDLGSRLRSPLTTVGITSSAASKVVKRSAHSRHSRRRRICRPSSARRESMTLVSECPQNGQCMGPTCPAAGPHAQYSDGLPAAVNREPLAQRHDFAAHALQRRLIAHVLEHVCDPVGHLLHFGLLEPARRRRRRSDAKSAGYRGRARVVRNRVLVDGHVRAAERRVGILAGDVLVDQVEQEEVIVGAARNDLVAAPL